MKGGGDMSDTKDPAIKLFGRTIPLPETQISDQSHVMDACVEIMKSEGEVCHLEECRKPNESSSLRNCKEEGQTSVQNKMQLDCQPKEDHANTNGKNQEKVFKKPDKVLSCPRCNSFDTKFCYFNNYNVNQPRHFCKKCQRYWTAGGTMRNVPVGAGRRKNKHLASQYRQLMVSSEDLPATRNENPDLASQQLFTCGEFSTPFGPSTGNGTVLKFGPEAPLCESMELVLNLSDQKSSAEIGSIHCGENGEEPSSSGYESSMTASSFRDNKVPEKGTSKEQNAQPGSCEDLIPPHPLQYYPVPPWGYPWNPSWNNVAPVAAVQCSSETVNPSPVQWCSPPVVAVPGFCTPSIPLQFLTASYWGCMPIWAAGTGNTMFSGYGGCLSPSSSAGNSSSGNGSPTLGKHSRDANLLEEEKSEKCILVPKTLRIVDPDEASKSPIWATLGINLDQKDFASNGDSFKAFKPKGDDKGRVSDGNQILGANPAAFSRSQTFQEST